MDAFKAQEHPHLHLEQLKAGYGLASCEKMESKETLGLEDLGIEKPKPGKYARRRARAKARLEVQETATRIRTQEHMRHIEDIRRATWCPPSVPSYEPLPIPPLGSSTNGWNPPSRSLFEPNVYRSAPIAPIHQPPQGLISNGNPQNITRYQPGQGFTPIHGPPPIRQQTTHRALQAVASRELAFRVASARNSTPARSTLSVAAYHGVPSYRIDKQYRQTKAPPSLDPPRGQADNHPDRTLPERPKPSHSSAKRSTPHRFPSNNPRIHLPAPKPSSQYLTLAHTPRTRLPHPQHLLLILDLNGTLLYRSPNSKTNYTPRPQLPAFLTHLLTHHSLLIWSSARPYNVTGMCTRLFTPEQRTRLLGEWGRDTLDLTTEHYDQKVQVYKRLDRIWNDTSLQRRHPGNHRGERWGQHNTLLIDDSVLKASAQPFNHVEVPEFVRGGGEERLGVREDGVLAQVMGYLEEARWWSDVSAFVRGRRFQVGKVVGGNGGEAGAEQRAERVEEQTEEEEDEDGGGVRL